MAANDEAAFLPTRAKDIPEGAFIGPLTIIRYKRVEEQVVTFEVVDLISELFPYPKPSTTRLLSLRPDDMLPIFIRKGL